MGEGGAVEDKKVVEGVRVVEVKEVVVVRLKFCLRSK